MVARRDSWEISGSLLIAIDWLSRAQDATNVEGSQKALIDQRADLHGAGLEVVLSTKITGHMTLRFSIMQGRADARSF